MQPAAKENPGGEWLLPGDVQPDDPRGAMLYVHGGGFVLGSPASHRAIAARFAQLTGRPVLAAHYRLAPEHSFPAALEDLQSTWRALTLDGERPIALAGDSAGGWLALALACYAATAGLRRPTGLALFSPLVELARAERALADDMLLPPGFVQQGIAAWRGDIPASDPRFDLLDASLAGLPPVYLAFDRDEALADDALYDAVAPTPEAEDGRAVLLAESFGVESLADQPRVEADDEFDESTGFALGHRFDGGLAAEERELIDLPDAADDGAVRADDDGVAGLESLVAPRSHRVVAPAD